MVEQLRRMLSIRGSAPTDRGPKLVEYGLLVAGLAALLVIVFVAFG